MSLKVSAIALAICLAACSRGQQQAPPSGSSAAPAQTPATPAQPPSTATTAPATPGTEAPAAEPPAATQAPTSSEPAAAAPQPADTTTAAAQKPKTTPHPSTPPTSAAQTPQPAQAPAAEPPPTVPEFQEVTIPEGTALNVRLTRAIGSDTSRVEDEVRGTLTHAIVVDGVTAIPAGTEVSGTVRSVARSGRVKGKASIAFRFEHVLMPDVPLGIQTAAISREAAADTKDDVKKGAIGGGAGAIVGGIIGGKKGAAIGAGVGATGAVVGTRGDEVHLAPGTIVHTTLQQPLKVQVRTGR